jgi:glutamate--cysteine ligase
VISVDVAGVEKRLIERYPDVEAWIKGHTEKVCFPIHSSVDLRDSGFKISSIDANIYPAGFNNLCESFIDRGGTLLRDFIAGSFGGIERIVIYPESHTRNKYYLQNLLSLKSIVERGGYEVLIATLDPKFPDTPTELEAIDGQPVKIHKLVKEGDLLRADGFKPDLILINNDFSDGRPEELIGVAQAVTPPVEMGWYSRSKYEHFRLYNSLVEEFAEILEVDPWLLSPITDLVEEIQFKNGDGVEQAAERVDQLIEQIAAKYTEHGIDQQPLVFVKDNAGTYGMGIVVVESGDELRGLNRSQRNKMSRGKGSSGISSVILQECIPTADNFNGHVGEPVVYMLGDQVLGGFFRYSETKSATDSLNSPGTQFAKLCMTEAEEFDEMLVCHRGHCSFELYYTIARIACLATGYEIRNRELCPPAISQSGIS